MAKIKLLIVMGPSGCGKSTIAKELANRLSNGSYVEGDQLHPKCNVDKMSNAIPLDDDDRWPWLQLIREHCENKAIEINDELDNDDRDREHFIIVTCSALKKIYRDRLRQIQHVEWIKFIFPNGSQHLVRERISQRKNHYMKCNMLASQYACLESPVESNENDVIQVDIEQSIDTIVEAIINHHQLCD
nr:probable gluconokinase [Dermatophagoides farinae]